MKKKIFRSISYTFLFIYQYPQLFKYKMLNIKHIFVGLDRYFLNLIESAKDFNF